MPLFIRPKGAVIGEVWYWQSGGSRCAGAGKGGRGCQIQVFLNLCFSILFILAHVMTNCYFKYIHFFANVSCRITHSWKALNYKLLKAILADYRILRNSGLCKCFFVKDLSSKSSVATLNSFGKKSKSRLFWLLVLCTKCSVLSHVIFQFWGCFVVSARYKKSELIPACSVFVSLVSEVHELGRFR